ncbi:long-chain fatty acid--CoA ligase [Patescibacteria group bacterium]|nr:long-chain fatty acid--CoA ligase [Patescibacteria group bacterium]
MPNTIPQQFFQTAQKYPKRQALKYKKDDTWMAMSFLEVENQVKDFASGLKHLGCKKGDRVAILSHNRPWWVVADLAIMSVGAVVVTVHTTFSPKLTAHVLRDSRSKFLVVSDQEQLTKVLLYQKELPDLQKIIYIDLAKPMNDIVDIRQLSFDEVLELGRRNKQSAVSSKLASDKLSEDDIASIIYTSGTTGNPNGVILTHKNFLSNSISATKAVPIFSKDTFLSFLPLSHILERTGGYYAPFVVTGACMAFAQSPKTLIDDLKAVKPTMLISVPRIFERFHKSVWDKVKAGSDFKRKLFINALKQQKGTWQYKIFDILVFKKIRGALGGRFRMTISGGSSLNPKLGKFFDKVGIIIIEGYGMTETSPIIAVNREGKIKYGTVGQAIEGVEIKIADDKEILVKSPGIMKGYTSLDREVIDQDGWFHTGDLGFLDNEGYLTIIGRKKEMMVLQTGKNIWPEKIEQVLNTDRFISQTVIIGHDKQYVTVLIVPDWSEVKNYRKEKNLSSKSPDNLITDSDMIKLYEERLECYKENFGEWELPKKFALLTDELSQENEELTPTLKLRRKTIEKNYSKEIGGMYA